MPIDFSFMIYPRLSDIENLDYDCEIVLDNNKHLSAHKIVLSSMSYYFETLFSTALINPQTTVFHVSYGDPESIEKVINIIYGLINVKEEQEIRLLYAMDFLLIKGFSITDTLKNMTVTENQLIQYIHAINEFLGINETTINYIIDNLNDKEINDLWDYIDPRVTKLILKYMNFDSVIASTMPSTSTTINLYHLTGQNKNVKNIDDKIDFEAGNKGRFSVIRRKDKVILLDRFQETNKKYTIDDVVIVNFCFSYDDKYLVVYYNDKLILLSTSDLGLKHIKTFNNVTTFTWSTDNQYILYYSKDEFIYYNIKNNNEFRSNFGTKNKIISICWHKNKFIVFTEWISILKCNLYIMRELTTDIIYQSEIKYPIIKYSLKGNYFIFYDYFADEIGYWINPNEKNFNLKIKDIKEFKKEFNPHIINIKISSSGNYLLINNIVVNYLEHKVILSVPAKQYEDICWTNNDYVIENIKNKINI